MIPENNLRLSHSIPIRLAVFTYFWTVRFLPKVTPLLYQFWTMWVFIKWHPHALSRVWTASRTTSDSIFHFCLSWQWLDLTSTWATLVLASCRKKKEEGCVRERERGMLCMCFNLRHRVESCNFWCFIWTTVVCLLSLLNLPKLSAYTGYSWI